MNVSYRLLGVFLYRDSESIANICKIVSSPPIRLPVVWSRPKLIEDPCLTIHPNHKKLDVRMKYVTESNLESLTNFLSTKLRVPFEIQTKSPF